MGSIFLVVEIFPGGEDVAVQNYFTTLKMSQKTACAPPTSLRLALQQCQAACTEAVLVHRNTCMVKAGVEGEKMTV